MADPAKRGLFRIQMGFITQHGVRMMFEPYGPFEVAEDHYRKEGYEPEFEALPWKDEYEGGLAAIKPAGEDVTHETEEERSPAFVGPSVHTERQTGWLEKSIAKLAALRVAKDGQATGEATRVEEDSVTRSSA